MTMKSFLLPALVIAMTLTPRPAAAKKPSLRQVIDHFFELVDSKAVDRFAEVDASDLVMKTPMGVQRGVEGHQNVTRGFAAAFPDFKHTVTQCVESGDRISCEGTFVGNHT